MQKLGQLKVKSDDGIVMFPGGFCYAWSMIVQSMHITFGDMALSMLKDIFSNLTYYKPMMKLLQNQDPKPVSQLVLLMMVHTISVYLIEISCNSYEDY